MCNVAYGRGERTEMMGQHLDENYDGHYFLLLLLLLLVLPAALGSHHHLGKKVLAVANQHVVRKLTDAAADG